MQNFDDQRSYLFAIAYRMLGSAADADDMVQEAWLRWQKQDRAGVENPRAWLASTVTRLCIDRLRELKRRRETYVGPWLPEPLVTQDPPDGGELAESLSLAFLTLIETLTVERAVFLLRQVFGYAYDEIAEIVGKSEAACRQQFSRAGKHIGEGKPRFETSPEAQQRMAQTFIEAMASGDLSRIESILREDVEFTSDGGGKAVAAMRVLKGRDVVARFLQGIASRAPADAAVELAVVNGQLGLLLKGNGKLESVFVIESIDGKAQAIRAIRNPDKLARLG